MPEILVEPKTTCFHCGQKCDDRSISDQRRYFCCTGCLSVYHLLTGAQLDGYYSDDVTPGVRPSPEISARHAYLDDPIIRSRLLEFQDREFSRITFHLPQMHCAACVWLLERLFIIQPGIQRSDVNFTHRRLTVLFRHDQISLRQLVELLAQLGYEPEIKLDSLDRRSVRNPNIRLYARIGVAGFSFANIMLFSLPEYFSGGLKEASLSLTFRLASLLLAAPVLLYSASDYFRSAWLGLRQRFVNLDVPISLGIGMLFGRSLFDIVTGSGPGYLDSFTGLVFFLLLGKLFQQKTFERLSFDRDYRSYFPIAATKLEPDRQASVSITELKPGDRILVRNEELIPADALLLRGQAHIDYSFVTGEAEPQTIPPMQKVYAGGRQIGAGIELEVLRPVSQSYLVSLWSGQQMSKDVLRPSVSLANVMGVWFTGAVLIISAAAFVYWMIVNSKIAPLAVTSVLIVACPCALALSSPFVLGTASRIWGKHKLFVRSPAVIETMFDLDGVVFDKTGTLTYSEKREVSFVGANLSAEERRQIASLARQSTHPASRSIGNYLSLSAPLPVSGYQEVPGEGIEAVVDGRTVRLGKYSWIYGAEPPVAGNTLPRDNSNVAHLSIDGVPRGEFQITSQFREGLEKTLSDLGQRYDLTVLSGDGAKEEERLRHLFGHPVRMLFERSSHAKLNEVADLTDAGQKVLMLGDGLNDAGALRAATVGIAVTEHTSAFSPACDAILDAESITKLSGFLSMARRCRTVIYLSFGLSLTYNVIGLSFAVSGHLSPLISAILMPISSISVVLFAMGSTYFVARQEGLS